MNRLLIALLLLALSATSRADDNLAIIADLNGRYGSTAYHKRVAAAVQSIISQRPALVVIAGDMIAGQAMPPLAEAAIDAMWQSFDSTVYRPLKEAGIPVAAAPGNHDASAYAAFSAERTAYERYWSARPPADSFSEGSRFPWYFGLDLEAVSLTFLDVTTTAELDSVQWEFLQQRREQARARQAKLVVVTHLPLHPIARSRETEIFSLPGSSLPGEIWVSGHHHAYYPGVTSNGAYHLAVPALGGNSRKWIGSSSTSPFGYVSLHSRGSVVLMEWPGFEPGDSPAYPASIGNLRAATALPTHAD